MFDSPNTLSRPGCDVKIYNPTTAVTGQGYQTWSKPRGISMVEMVVIGGGGGGGGGASTAGGGGGGGACSGISRFLVPAIFLPDTLYVQVGSGGLGGVSGSNGGSGINSFVLTSKTAVLPNIVCYANINLPGGGGTGTAGAQGSAGTVPTVAVTQPVNSLGFWFALVGVAGELGGVHTGGDGTDNACWAARFISEGAGGAGTAGVDTLGGDQGSSNAFNCGNQRHYTNAADGIAAGGVGGLVNNNGGSGPKLLTPFVNAGGAGGGSNVLGQAGNGGTGGYGCGGGGGGAGLVGGRGGNGGPGLVIIISW